jgi:hypothetical protein
MTVSGNSDGTLVVKPGTTYRLLVVTSHPAQGEVEIIEVLPA